MWNDVQDRLKESVSKVVNKTLAGTKFDSNKQYVDLCELVNRYVFYSFSLSSSSSHRRSRMYRRECLKELQSNKLSFKFIVSTSIVALNSSLHTSSMALWNSESDGIVFFSLPLSLSISQRRQRHTGHFIIRWKNTSLEAVVLVFGIGIK